MNGASVWDYRAQNPEEGRSFDAAMTGLSRQVSQSIVEAYDFGKFGRVVDVGGGRGVILAAILAANPSLRGVLFDQPHVVANAGPVLGEAGVADRCEIAGGDFFESVPAGGDAYVLKAILHDWHDAEAIRILRACRAAIPAGGTLVLVEQVIAKPNEGLIGKLSDLNMLVAPSGRERTAAEFTELLAQADFRLNSIKPTMSAVSIIEGQIQGVRSEVKDQPMQIRVRCDKPGMLASRFFEQDHVVEAKIHEDGKGLLVRTRDADSLYLLLNRIVLESGLEVEAVAPADDDVNSVYQYLIGPEGGAA